MSERSVIKEHVQTSLAARVVYRIICVVLIISGLFSLTIAYGLFDKYIAYTRRDRTTNGVVLSIDREEPDEYGYIYCGVIYKFKVNGHEYSSATSLERIPLGRNCDLGEGDQIVIRYEDGHPANNAYGDNTLARDINRYFTITLTLLSILPLGTGFVGLVAIHKALRTENELEKAEIAASRQRAHRRSRAKAAKKAESAEADEAAKDSSNKRTK